MQNTLNENKKESEKLEKELEAIFQTPYVPIYCQAYGESNFPVPHNVQIGEKQISALKNLGWVISGMECVKKPGMEIYLHIWIHKVRDWENSEIAILKELRQNIKVLGDIGGDDALIVKKTLELINEGIEKRSSK